MTEIKSFKIGDVVRCTATDAHTHNLIGVVAVVLKDRTDGFTIGVVFSNFVGHNLGGRIHSDNGWWCSPNQLELVEEPEVNKVELIRDPENGSLPCNCECSNRALSCCLDEVTAPEGYFDAHYNGVVQPIELMQMIMSPEEFIGFLKGNIIKYTMRLGKKDVPEKELTKIKRYASWLDQARQGEIINPRL